MACYAPLKLLFYQCHLWTHPYIFLCSCLPPLSSIRLKGAREKLTEPKLWPQQTAPTKTGPRMAEEAEDRREAQSVSCL